MDVSGKRNDTTTDVCHRMGQHDTTNTKILFFVSSTEKRILFWFLDGAYAIQQHRTTSLFCSNAFPIHADERADTPQITLKLHHNGIFLVPPKTEKKTLFWDENLLLYSIPFFLSLLFSFLSFFFFLFFLFSLRARSARLKFFRSARAEASKTRANQTNQLYMQGSGTTLREMASR